MSVEIKELREQQLKISTEARSVIDEVPDGAAENVVKDAEKRFDAMMAKYDEVGARADRIERADEARKAAEAAIEARRPLGADTEAPGSSDPKRPDYRSAFHSYLSASGNLGELTDEERSVLSAGRQDIESRAQTTANAAGGYMVPTELANILVETMVAYGPMYDPGVTSEIVTSGGYTMTMPTVDDTASTAGAHTEGQALTDDGGKDVTFGEKSLEAYAFDTEWLKISKELIDDSTFAVETIIGRLLGERLARIANLQLTTGSGSSAPHGVVTAAPSGKTAASGTAITWDEIIDLEHSVDPAYRASPNVRFMLNDSTLSVLRKLKDGDGNYLWNMGDVKAGVSPTINGRPYSINQAMPGIATGNKAMLFGDFSRYYVRKVGAPLIGAISDKDFWPGVGIAGYIRFDGELADTAAIKALTLA